MSADIGSGASSTPRPGVQLAACIDVWGRPVHTASLRSSRPATQGLHSFSVFPGPAGGQGIALRCYSREP
jgi:hypothetical protein